MVRREVTVRRAELSDCAALAAIDAASNSGSWGEGGFAEFLGGSVSMLLLAETEGEIAGFIACELQGDLMAVDELAVAPSRRRMGIATTLMDTAEAVARALFRIWALLISASRTILSQVFWALTTASFIWASFLRYSSSLPTRTRILLLSSAFSLYRVT